MTYSILVQDDETGALGAAAATGSLCVGGWVLRGRWGAGLSASQGAAPSVSWGEEALTLMRAGQSAPEVVAGLTSADRGREWRQMAALDSAGRTAAFTGARNTPAMGHHAFPGGIASGNMLASEAVVRHLADGYLSAGGTMAERLLAALRAAEAAGSDSRGLLSAALLVLRPDAAPLTLRIDHHESDPIGALEALHRRATRGDYAAWAAQVPHPADPERGLD
ncbi:DUF1028 domain-containing protein [Histidinibacterium lentulum]|uniref:DUF1028 domain-containing protein n=1 Tax=Histidinibacterium lentulum TaxID=2480588 RepID=A0A3N2QSB7_9RHOB|nr:DUF1028 domain-containing protein [Histidinibacterium lentulum]ROT98060.1 DUF1028 domain-containing protein [Histidinibacterium lentulum]